MGIYIPRPDLEKKYKLYDSDYLVIPYQHSHIKLFTIVKFTDNNNIDYKTLKLEICHNYNGNVIVDYETFFVLNSNVFQTNDIIDNNNYLDENFYLKLLPGQYIRISNLDKFNNNQFYYEIQTNLKSLLEVELSFLIQKEIKENCHAINYLLNNVAFDSITAFIKLELIRKDKASVTILDLPLEVYNQILRQFIPNYTNNLIFLNFNSNLILNQDHYLMVTFYGQTTSNDIPTLDKFELNKLFVDSNNYFEIQKKKYKGDFEDTNYFQYVYIPDFSSIKSLEGIMNVKYLNNQITQRQLYLTADFFTLKSQNLLSLYHNQKIKFNTDDSNFYYYLIKLN